VKTGGEALGPLEGQAAQHVGRVVGVEGGGFVGHPDFPDEGELAAGFGDQRNGSADHIVDLFVGLVGAVQNPGQPVPRYGPDGDAIGKDGLSVTRSGVFLTGGEGDIDMRYDEGVVEDVFVGFELKAHLDIAQARFGTPRVRIGTHKGHKGGGGQVVEQTVATVCAVGGAAVILEDDSVVVDLDFLKLDFGPGFNTALRGETVFETVDGALRLGIGEGGQQAENGQGENLADVHGRELLVGRVIRCVEHSRWSGHAPTKNWRRSEGQVVVGFRGVLAGQRGLLIELGIAVIPRASARAGR
jgi:hypothetical protein